MQRASHIRVLIPVVTIIIMVVAMSAAFFIIRQDVISSTNDNLKRSIQNRLNLIQGVSEQFIEQGLNNHLKQMISSIASEPDVILIVVADKNDNILVSNNYSHIGTRWQDVGEDINVSIVDVVRNDRKVKHRLNSNAGFIEGYTSVCGKGGELILRQMDCGFALYRISLGYHYKNAENILIDQMFLFIVGLVIAVIVILVLLNFVLYRPVQKIIRVLEIFNKGDRTARIQVNGRNEISDVSNAINHVLDEIVSNEETIKTQEERLRAVIDTAVDAIITIDKNGIVQTINPAVEQHLGYTNEDLVGQNISKIMPTPHRDEHDSYLEKYHSTGVRNIIGKNREVLALTKSGKEVPVELSVTEMHINGEVYFSGILRDISERVQLREALENVNRILFNSNLDLKSKTRIDPLTGLCNRGFFDETLDEEIHRAIRNGVHLSLIMMDVDHFKLYNDHYGHQQGDECLKSVAKAMKECFQRSGDVLARYGGEEFCVIMPNIDANRASEMAEKLRDAVYEKAIAHEASRTSDRVTISVGVSTIVPTSTALIDSKDFINSADKALYDAKAGGRNCVVSTTLSN